MKEKFIYHLSNTKYSSNKALKSFPLILNQSKVIVYFAPDRSISLAHVKPDQS